MAKTTKLRAFLDKHGIPIITFLDAIKWNGQRGMAKGDYELTVASGYRKVDGRITLSATDLVKIKKAIQKLTKKPVRDEDVVGMVD